MESKARESNWFGYIPYGDDHYEEFDLLSGDDARYDSPYNEFDLLSGDEARAISEKKALGKIFADGRNVYGFSNNGSHELPRSRTTKSTRKPMLTLNKEKSMWHRLLEDDSYGEQMGYIERCIRRWGEINSQYNMRSTETHALMFKELFFEFIWDIFM